MILVTDPDNVQMWILIITFGLVASIVVFIFAVIGVINALTKYGEKQTAYNSHINNVVADLCLDNIIQAETNDPENKNVVLKLPREGLKGLEAEIIRHGFKGKQSIHAHEFHEGIVANRKTLKDFIRKEKKALDNRKAVERSSQLAQGDPMIALFPLLILASPAEKHYAEEGGYTNDTPYVPFMGYSHVDTSGSSGGYFVSQGNGGYVPDGGYGGGSDSGGDSGGGGGDGGGGW